MSSQRSYHSQAALDLMAQLQDPQCALEAARIEDQADCVIGAGPELETRLGQFMVDPHRSPSTATPPDKNLSRSRTH